VYRYHRTIKALVGSTQVTISTLLHNLLQVADVRTISAKHAAFERAIKQSTSVPPELDEYRACVSQFAFELIVKQFTKAKQMAADDNAGFTSPCACSFNVSYQLPCRHFFANSLQSGDPCYDASLVHWAPASAAPMHRVSTPAVNVVTLPMAVNTHQQRFKLAMSRCNMIASILAEPASAALSNALHYPVAVKQRGRPKKRKQRLFEQKNRWITFERLPVARRDLLRLTWLVSNEVATDAIEHTHVIQATDVMYGYGMAMCADERSKFKEMEVYFEKDTWKTLLSQINSYDQNATVCSVCRQVSGVGTTAKVKWIQCDGCLVWVHVSCTEFTHKPRGNWFCSSCED